MAACYCCENARDAHGYNLFHPRCKWCAARRIQFIQRRLAIGAEQKRQRCRQVLADALAAGHLEAEVRKLAKDAALAIAPKGGAC